MFKSSYKFRKKTIKDIELKGKTILLRADYNVPLNEDGSIASDFRITQSIPTIRYLLKQNCKIIIIAHLGRPEGKINPKFSLSPIAQHLHSLLPEIMVGFAADCINDGAILTCKKAGLGDIILLENLRFHEGEEANDVDFANKLKRVSGADYFVQDGFGIVHRPHASTEAITHLLPSVAGLLLEKEVTVLSSVMSEPVHPVVAVVGGAKISDKIGFIEKLTNIADTILIGGAMANTFLKHKGNKVGKSLVENDQDQEIATILQKSKPNQILLPQDVAVAKEIATDSQRRDCNLNDIKDDDIILDLGFETMRLFNQKISSASTVIWNGTLGYAELPQFARSSGVLADSITSVSGLESIVGGGDTADFALDWLKQNVERKFSHISTGGGASLELMSGMKLPGVEALLNN